MEIKGTVFYPVKRKNEVKIAACDALDWCRFKASKKTVQACSSGKKPWYIAYRHNGKRTQFHRVIMDCPKGYYIDHINNNGLDNRKNNLRVVTMKQNNQNVKARSGARSKYRGVSIHSDGRYRARINKDGKKYEIGLFQNENEAALAYNKKAIELYGEFAYQNKVRGLQ